MSNLIRCHWATQNQLAQEYHDQEWGVPCHHNSKLFELLTLEIFQAGLSWNTILKKRLAFKIAFDNFDVRQISQYSDKKIKMLLQNSSIIRNRKKIEATINNAKVVLKLPKSLNEYLWQFTDFKTIKHHYQNYHEIPSKTELSIKISKQMKEDGFKFTGPITIQSFIQAIGMVNDHETSCFKY
ncbi:DNA-3-methyladenine glycosylase I [Ligilactobacillus araffinosus DSM 20653]|uniref:DNA-3-methyladenine glycosylase I n=1 Tax=Ligilactobacillus araffinosus DSM 20653 TaxID=1423820 RepID=A0A0R1ZA99_9LACO|nr:DNA-3-methyladenine glycosylase I [Ligilactobacillus araffinosus DSM 20653]